MSNVALFATIAMLAVGCKTKTVTVTVPKVRTDTLIITKAKRDSIWLHDSVYVSEKTENDTVFLEIKKWHTKYVEKIVRDTTYIAKHDTIPMPYPVEVIKEVERELTWWQKVRMFAGSLMLAMLGFGLIAVLLKMKGII
jgi:hypothetical protein